MQPRVALGLAGMCAVLGCSASEAPRVELPVVVDGSGLAAATTDLGWTIEFEQVSIALRDLEFTTAGELDMGRAPTTGRRPLTTWRARLGELIISSAWAHPGHEQGGEIIGELAGAWVIDFVADDARELGLATLIVGDYTALNFGFDRAAGGHTALLQGTATRAGVEVGFVIAIDSPLDRELVGALFDVTIAETTAASIGLRWLAVDPIEGDHLFDGIDFAALDVADGLADATVVIGDPEANPGAQAAALDEAYFEIRREFQTHDLWQAVLIEP